MYEVELTARLVDYAQTRLEIEKLTFQSYLRLDYDDRYFDKDNTLTSKDQEFRLRTKTNLKTGEARHYLTFKDSAFEKLTRSKPEFETLVTDHPNTEQILFKLGYVKTAHYTKHCEIFNLNFKNTEIEIALVRFDELQDSFIEIETQTDQKDQTDELFGILYELLEKLNISKSQLTEDFYIEMIKEAKAKQA